MLLKKVITASKNDLSEISLRKILYWVEENINISTNEDESHWMIIIESPESEIDSHFNKINKLVNDFILREKIASETEHLRKKIINNALNRLAVDD